MSGSKFQQTRHWEQYPAATWDCGPIFDNVTMVEDWGAYQRLGNGQCT